VPRYTTKLTRLAVLGLSVGALLPATAAAMPIRDAQATAQPVQGQSVAAGGGPGVTATTLSSPAHTGAGVIQATPKPTVGGGDVVSGGGYQIAPATSEPAPPVFPTNTKALPRPAAANSDDGGVDTGVLLAIGGAVLLALGAAFFFVARKPRARERQPA
jgi:hypothetical protein